MYLQVAFLYQRVKAVHGGIGLEERFAIELVECVRFLALLIDARHLLQCLAEVFRQGQVGAYGREQMGKELIGLQLAWERVEAVLFGQFLLQLLGFRSEQTRIRMLQYGHYLLIEIASGLGVVSLNLKVEQGLHVAIHGSLRERETHGDVHMLYLFGERMEHRLEDAFVAEYHGRFLFLLGQVLAYPLGQIACLGVFGRSADVANLLRAIEGLHLLPSLFGESRRELLKVALDEFARLMMLLAHVVGIVIPIEERLSGIA